MHTWQMITEDDCCLYCSGYLNRKEARIQEVENKIRAARDAKIKAEREAKAKGE